MARRMILALAAMLAVGACSTSVSTAVPASAATQAPAAQSAPTSLSALADNYSALANPVNAAVDQCNKDLNAAGNDLAKLKAAAGECLAAYTGFTTALGASQWGPVQPQVDALITAMTTYDLLWQQMAGATSLSDFQTANNQTTVDTGWSGAISALRSALGLPPVSQSTPS